MAFSFRKNVVATLVILAGLAVLPGCSILIGPGNPRPNIVVASQKKSLRVVISDSIPNDFDPQTPPHLRNMHVQGWHQTLEKGFSNGFGDSMRVVDSGTSDWTLKIDNAELEYVSAAVNGYGNVVALTAQIRFKASLQRDGEELRLAGTVESKKATSQGAEIPALAYSAIETMYEKIAADLFNRQGGK